ncbi:hypothetical protein [Motiliproteus sediminis]|uniref:hypothetical protein n=1 Tax=Motiliproteus sediminis TaxID=1468178 RepID=UPI001AEF65FF|nr:hypothetical protein [Motiliproteus sediminis]
MKKKFELHLDAVVVIVLLFVAALAMNYVQYRIYADLAAENRKLQLQALEDQLNLESLRIHVDRLNSEQTQVNAMAGEN